MLATKQGLLLTPNMISAVAQVCPWLADWRPVEAIMIGESDEPLRVCDHPVRLYVVKPPVPVPALNDVPNLAVNPNFFSADPKPIFGRLTHLWGGPMGRRKWHEAVDFSGHSVDLNWYSVLANLTLVDQGLMVRTTIGEGVDYLLFHWGQSNGLTEAAIALREGLLAPI